MSWISSRDAISFSTGSLIQERWILVAQAPISSEKKLINIKNFIIDNILSELWPKEQISKLQNEESGKGRKQYLHIKGKQQLLK